MPPSVPIVRNRGKYTSWPDVPRRHEADTRDQGPLPGRFELCTAAAISGQQIALSDSHSWVRCRCLIELARLAGHDGGPALAKDPLAAPDQPGPWAVRQRVSVLDADTRALRHIQRRRAFELVSA